MWKWPFNPTTDRKTVAPIKPICTSFSWFTSSTESTVEMPPLDDRAVSCFENHVKSSKGKNILRQRWRLMYKCSSEKATKQKPEKFKGRKGKNKILTYLSVNKWIIGCWWSETEPPLTPLERGEDRSQGIAGKPQFFNSLLDQVPADSILQEQSYPPGFSPLSTLDVSADLLHALAHPLDDHPLQPRIPRRLINIHSTMMVIVVIRWRRWYWPSPCRRWERFRDAELDPFAEAYDRGAVGTFKLISCCTIYWEKLSLVNACMHACTRCTTKYENTFKCIRYIRIWSMQHL